MAHYAERVALGLAEEGEGGNPPPVLGLVARVEAYEAALVRETLQACAGDARTAMAALRLPRKTFYDKLNRHGIRIDDYRRGASA